MKKRTLWWGNAHSEHLMTMSIFNFMSGYKFINFGYYKIIPVTNLSNNYIYRSCV